MIKASAGCPCIAATRGWKKQKVESYKAQNKLTGNTPALFVFPLSLMFRRLWQAIADCMLTIYSSKYIYGFSCDTRQTQTEGFGRSTELTDAFEALGICKANW